MFSQNRQRLLRPELHGRMPRKRPGLKKKKTDPLEFHVEEMLWLDGTKLELFCPKRRHHVWYKTTAAIILRTMLFQFRMVLAVLSCGDEFYQQESGKLISIEEKMNGAKNRNTSNLSKI